jgi:ribosomal protein S18 acetylase RimI-like enzyme
MQENALHLLEYYEQAERFFWSNISIDVTQIDDTEVYCSGVNSLYLNSAIQRKSLSEANLQRTLEQLKAFYQHHNVSWVWIFREDLCFDSLLSSPHLQMLDRSTMMYYNLNDTLPALYSVDLSIIENNEDLRDWGFCLTQAFGNSAETPTNFSQFPDQYISAHKNGIWNTKAFHHFVGYLNNTPVTCATLSLNNSIARIDDVGTIPEHQHKGYATQMIHHILTLAKLKGVDICFLESSSIGLNVYEKLGFKTLDSNVYYQVIS